MPKRAILGSLLLVGLGVFLGGTVLGDQVATARPSAQAVEISNTPLPVQGTVNANVTNSSLTVAPRVATKTGCAARIQAGSGANADVFCSFPGGVRTVNSTLVVVTNQVGSGGVLTFQNTNSTTGTETVLQFTLQEDHDLVIPLLEAVPINNIHLHCFAACGANFNLVGS